MSRNDPIRTGTALSITVGFAYTVCSVFFWLWPQAAVVLANALFHGLDFRKLQAGAALFDLTGFVSAVVMLMVWTFLLGALFAWLREAGGRRAA